LAAFAVALVGCSSKKDPEELADADEVPARTTNPDGVPYPTDHQGGNARASGRPGDRIPNFAFRGYPNGDRSKGLQTLSMADYFDPQQKRHKVLHIEVSATWCATCSAVISATVENKEALNARGITYLEIIVSGASAGFGPSLDEVDGWVTRHRSNIDTAIDVRGRRLRSVGLIQIEVMPHDILVDTRTMEILESSDGAPLDIGAYGRGAVDWVTTHPPSY
jgi:hypothetical protein